MSDNAQSLGRVAALTWRGPPCLQPLLAHGLLILFLPRQGCVASAVHGLLGGTASLLDAAPRLRLGLPVAARVVPLRMLGVHLPSRLREKCARCTSTCAETQSSSRAWCLFLQIRYASSPASRANKYLVDSMGGVATHKSPPRYVRIFSAINLDLNWPPDFCRSTHLNGIGRRPVRCTTVAQGTSVNTPISLNTSVSSALDALTCMAEGSLRAVSP